MFPVQWRLPLRKTPDFFSTARRLSSAHFVVFYLSAKDTKTAIIVPAKHASTKVAKNTIKRRLKEIILEILKNTDIIKSSCHFVVSVRSPVKNMTFVELTQEMSDLIAKMHHKVAHQA